MNSPDVTLTDYAITVECAVFCVLILRRPYADQGLRTGWLILFASIGMGSLLGGTVHGFFNDPVSVPRVALWTATLLCLGVTATAMLLIGSRLGLRERPATLLRRFAYALLAAYAIVVLFVDTGFYVAIAVYLSASVFLLATWIRMYRRSPERRLLLGITGVALTFVAAAVQQTRLGVHPVYFDHNALYHVIQAVALLLAYLASEERPVSAPAFFSRATAS